MFSAPISSSFRGLFDSKGIKVHETFFLRRNISKNDVYAFFELIRFFKKNKFDIVHTNSTKPGVVARIAARIAGCKNVVHTVHGIAYHEFETKPKRIIYYLLELVSCLFGKVNITVNNSYLKYYPTCITKSFCIYNGVDFNKLNKLNIAKSYISVGFFARLDEQKAPDIFIRVVNVLIQRGVKNVRFVLAGDGEQLTQCKELMTELGLDDKIEILGWINDKSQFLSSVDILLHPSRWEAFGLSVVEAAFFEIPTVASNVEGLPEVIIDGETGFICEVDNVTDFADRTYQLITDDVLRCKMGAQANKYVMGKFNLEKMIFNYDALYKKIMNLD